MNYFRIGNLNANRNVVDSPGYGYLGMQTSSGDKLKKMISKYAKESSR
jgi:GTP-binding protein EngB required for normal cell division